jgi:hypothetical protein
MEQKTNANRLYKFFIGQGWTRKSIAAMLGNVQVESTINPGLWQGRTAPIPPETPYTTSKGFGLTQWTPANKLITWADGFSLDYTLGDTQTGRIQYEMVNGLQWGNDVDISFWNFAHDDTQTLERLTLAWLWDYERPSAPDIPARQANAVFWYDTVGKLPIWLLFKMAQRRN